MDSEVSYRTRSGRGNGGTASRGGFDDPLLDLQVADLRRRAASSSTARRSAGSPTEACSAGSVATATTRASEAITEQVRAIPAHASIHTARYALSQSGATRLLVRSRRDQLPEGVLSDFDLAVAIGR